MSQRLAEFKVLIDGPRDLDKKRIEKSPSIKFSFEKKPTGKVILMYNIDPEGGKTREYAIYHKKERRELKKKYEDEPSFPPNKPDYMYKTVEEISKLTEGSFGSGVKRLLWEAIDGEKFDKDSNTLYFQSSTGGIEISDVVLFFKKDIDSGETAEKVTNFTLWEEEFNLELANPEFSWKTTLGNLRIREGLKAILGYCANPEGGSNLSHRIFVNNEEIKESKLTAAVLRNLIECFDTKKFEDYENHNIKFEVYDGRGEMNISDGVLWFPIDAPVAGVAADYYVVKDTDDPIFLDSKHPHNPKTKDFNLPDDIITDAKALFGCKMNPTGVNDLDYNIKVNGHKIKDGTYHTGHIRTRWWWFPADYLIPGDENQVVCEVTGGDGTLEISDMVVWCKRRLG